MTLAAGAQRATTFGEYRARLHEIFCEWWAWYDGLLSVIQDKEDAFDLASLAAASCQEVSASDTNFADYLQDSAFPSSPAESEIYERRSPEALARWQKHQARRPNLSETEFADLRSYIAAKYRDTLGAWQDVGSHVQILKDRQHRFPGGDARAFAAAYVSTLPPGWRESIVVSLAMNAHPVVLRWTDERLHIDETRQWCAGQRLTNGDPRFVALTDHVFGTNARVMIPATTPARPEAASLAELALKPPSRAVVVHPTGLDALDAVLVNGGLPLAGARVVVQAPTGHAKTTIALAAAEAYAAAGITVAWLASPDELAESVIRRRLQRLGLSRSEAAIAPLDDSRLDSQLVVIDGRTTPLETVLRLIDQTKRETGHDVVLFVDTLQKTPLADPPAGEVEHVRRALALLEGSGLTVWMTSSLVRGAARRSAVERSKGGSGIEGGATLLLDVALTGDDLTITIQKSRHGGERAVLELTLDREHQRVAALPAGAVTDVEARIWADVQRELAHRGPTSVKALAEQIVRGKAPTIRAVIREKLKAGLLVDVGGKAALP